MGLSYVMWLVLARVGAECHLGGPELGWLDQSCGTTGFEMGGVETARPVRGVRLGRDGPSLGWAQVGSECHLERDAGNGNGVACH